MNTNNDSIAQDFTLHIAVLHLQEHIGRVQVVAHIVRITPRSRSVNIRDGLEEVKRECLFPGTVITKSSRWILFKCTLALSSPNKHAQSRSSASKRSLIPVGVRNCSSMRANPCSGALGFKYPFWIRASRSHGHVCFTHCKRRSSVSGNECCKRSMMADCASAVTVWTSLARLLWCCKWILFLWRCATGPWRCWFSRCGEARGWSGRDHSPPGCCPWAGARIAAAWGLPTISFKTPLPICVDHLQSRSQNPGS